MRGGIVVLNLYNSDYFGEKSIFEGFQKIIDSIEQVCQVVAAIEFAFVELSAFIVKFRMKSELVAFPYYDVIFHFQFPFRPLACLFLGMEDGLGRPHDILSRLGVDVDVEIRVEVVNHGIRFVVPVS